MKLAEGKTENNIVGNELAYCLETAVNWNFSGDPKADIARALSVMKSESLAIQESLQKIDFSPARCPLCRKIPAYTSDDCGEIAMCRTVYRRLGHFVLSRPASYPVNFGGLAVKVLPCHREG